MPTTVTNTADSSIIHQNNYIADDFNSAGLIENNKQIEQDYGIGSLRQWIFDGIYIGYSKWNYTDYVAVQWKADLDVVHLHFNLRGKILMDYSSFGEKFVLNSYQHNMFYSNGFEGVVTNLELYSETFMIQFTKETFIRLTQGAGDKLKRFGEQIMEGRPIALARNNLYIDIKLHNAIKDVIECDYPEGLKKMYLFSKCIEILATQAEAFAKEENAQVLYCKSEYDQERILFARDYLIQHIEMPPSLSGLARIAGINEFKLKRGFKEIFNNTVFGYLSDYRLEEAKRALIENRKTATEIAFELGYSSLQHFSTAFKKKFGVSPKGRG